MRKIFGVFVAGAVSFCLASCESEEVDPNKLAAIEAAVEEIDGSYIGLVDYGTITNSSGVSVSKNTITITSGGTYTIIGELSDGQLVIDTDADTTLILNGVDITNKDNAAIYIYDADLTTITLVEGTVNKLSDGSSYSSTSENINATLYSKDTVIINGTGTLEIDANYDNAIVSKDSLVIESGTFIIDAVGDAIYGKDDLTIYDGTFDITTGGGSAEVDMSVSEGSTGGPGGSRPRSYTVSEIGLFDWLTGSDDEITSSKGFKSQGLITIEDGIFAMDTYDDAVHSDTDIVINSGEYSIKSGDDGIHADASITIYGGDIDISYCYEGIESNYVTMNGGTVSVVANDDGINAPTLDGTNGTIEINDGNISVVASGDGLDSNGKLVVNGGNVYVEGSSNGSNGALDYDTSAYINGGTFLATGNSQMAQGFSSSSSQTSFMGTFSGTMSSGSTVVIKDQSGNVLASTTVTNSFNSIVVSSPSLVSGSTYYIVVSGTQYSFTA